MDVQSMVGALAGRTQFHLLNTHFLRLLLLAHHKNFNSKISGHGPGESNDGPLPLP